MGSMIVDFLDVGMGDSTLVRMSNAKNPKWYDLVLVDFGEQWSPKNVAVKDATNFLIQTISDNSAARGLAEPTIDCLVVTHPDADHYNKILKLCGSAFPGFAGKQLKILEMFYCGANDEFDGNFVSDVKAYCDEQYYMTDSFHSAVVKKAVTPFRYYANSSAKMYVLAANFPSRANKVKQGKSTPTNAKSMVLLFELDNTAGVNNKVILMGDAEEVVEKEILKSFDKSFLDCYALKLGHHGAKGATSAEWVENTQPAAIFASGDMKWAHPYCEAINRGAKYLKVAPSQYRYCCGESKEEDYTNNTTKNAICMNLWYFALKDANEKALSGKKIKVTKGTAYGVQWTLTFFSDKNATLAHSAADDYPQVAAPVGDDAERGCGCAELLPGDKE